MRAFYAVLVLIALVGGAVMFWASRGVGGPQFIEKPVPLNTATFAGFVIGSDSAPVEIVEYADFQCGACGYFAVLSGPDIKQRLVGSGLVRWRFRGFPLPGHDRSLMAHHAAACAGEQNRFWEMHDQLFFNQRAWVESTRPEREMRNLAVAAGVDAAAYEECMKEERYLARIQATKNEIAALGISSTPTFDIGRLRVSGSIPFDSVKALVDLALTAQGQ
jgi:protein-disulfide isomerase